MINEEYKAMLGGKSVIRELSEYATSRGAEIGYQNVFDYSLGNPSVPAPKSFTDAMVDLYENGDPVAIHGYSPSLGIPSVKDAIAENLNERFGMAYTGNHIFPTTGAAGALSHAMRAVTKPGDEIITFAPYFPEYQPYVKGAGAKLTSCRPTPRTSKSTSTHSRLHLTRTCRSCLSTPRTTRPARCIQRTRSSVWPRS